MSEAKEARNYNGWANYETWAVKLWLGNEEPSYRYWTEQARSWHGREGAALGLARELEDELCEGNPLDEASLYSDLLRAALGEVDWLEIAESYLEDVEPIEAEAGRRLSLDEIERLPRKAFEALPASEGRRYFDHMDRENFPTPEEFYGYAAEREWPAEWPRDDEEWTEAGDSCDGRDMPEPTPERRPDREPTPPAPLDAEGLFGGVMFAYTRRQAIADGVLVDVSETAKEAGFRVPVALTRAVWAEYVAVPQGVVAQDEAGRLWDVLWMCRHGIAGGEARDASEVPFQLHVRNDNREGEPPLVTLKAVCGPDDDAGPCITVMRPEED